jgi:hypothetical protein
MKRLFLYSLTAFGLLLAPLRADAGIQDEWTYCTKNKDGSGYCAGTFRGYRNHPDPNTSVHFAYSSNGGSGVQVNYDGQAHVCMTQPGSAVDKMWPMSISHSGNFQLSWDAAGTCTWLYLGNGSADRSF